MRDPFRRGFEWNAATRTHDRQTRRRIGRPDRRRASMYARVITFSGADSSKREPALEMIRGTVIPMLQSYDGFAGYISLYDEANSRAKAIILWETKEAADGAEKALTEPRKGMVSPVGMTIESAGRSKVPV